MTILWYQPFKAVSILGRMISSISIGHSFTVSSSSNNQYHSHYSSNLSISFPFVVVYNTICSQIPMPWKRNWLCEWSSVIGLSKTQGWNDQLLAILSKDYATSILYHIQMTRHLLPVNTFVSWKQPYLRIKIIHHRIQNQHALTQPSFRLVIIVIHHGTVLFIPSVFAVSFHFIQIDSLPFIRTWVLNNWNEHP